MKRNTRTKDSKAQKPLARIVAYRHFEDEDGKTKSVKAELGAVWPTKEGTGERLSFKFVPAELLTGDCQLYLFPIEDGDED
jgi:hypothetical protein